MVQTTSQRRGGDEEIALNTIIVQGSEDESPSPISSPKPSPPKQEFTKTRTIVLVVSFYFIISIATVFLNKHVMNFAKYKFNYPTTMTWFQMVFALICIVVTFPLNKRVPFLSFLPDLQFDLNIAKEIAPLTLVFVLMLSFNNICLMYVDVGFYQVARSLSIVFTVLLTCTFLGDTISSKALMALIAVFIGYLVGAVGGILDKGSSLDTQKNIYWGIITGIFSSFFVALYGIYVKRKLPLVQQDAWVLLIYNTVLATIFLIPCIFFFGELPHVLDLQLYREVGFWVSQSVPALCGYLVNVAMFFQIRYTSALTNTVSGTAKACVQTLVGMVVFQEHAGILTICGTLVCIFASTWYSKVRSDENEEAKRLAENAIKQ